MLPQAPQAPTALPSPRPPDPPRARKAYHLTSPASPLFAILNSLRIDSSPIPVRAVPSAAVLLPCAYPPSPRTPHSTPLYRPLASNRNAIHGSSGCGSFVNSTYTYTSSLRSTRSRCHPTLHRSSVLSISCCSLIDFGGFQCITDFVEFQILFSFISCAGTDRLFWRRARAHTHPLCLPPGVTPRRLQGTRERRLPPARLTGRDSSAQVAQSMRYSNCLLTRKRQLRHRRAAAG